MVMVVAAVLEQERPWTVLVSANADASFLALLKSLCRASLLSVSNERRPLRRHPRAAGEPDRVGSRGDGDDDVRLGAPLGRG